VSSKTAVVIRPIAIGRWVNTTPASRSCAYSASTSATEKDVYGIPSSTRAALNGRAAWCASGSSSSSTPAGASGETTVSQRWSPLIRREWDPVNDLDADTVKATPREGAGRVDPPRDPRTPLEADGQREVREAQRVTRLPEVRGVATDDKPAPRDRLTAVRAAWGDFDKPLVVAATNPLALFSVDDDEDF
jgi:hypothetical protein